MINGYYYSPSTGGFYHSRVNSDIPTDVVAITDTEHDALLSAQNGGAQITAGDSGLPQARVPTVDLAKLKASLTLAIDNAAEKERLKYITMGAGQAMTYQQKADEALRFIAAATPLASDYPLLSAEVGITAADIAGVAAVVNIAHKQWLVIGAKIEAVRLGAKVNITAAVDAHAAMVAFEDINWP
ncbi:hypothetical protein PDO_1871 [Rhizobium sp. PDO1-076]|uniref:hypothetical protein n=1 Tax=Rhizobium sp. PDO1-076 TaxID=1125979 RepID=UPI00024E3437|nr:hypothetical protein [Rhizobium sp. PDO1-076]EHS51480.1 hypothetical protein PDO_1871 [Rhizobium sp. PDO1-076]